MKICVVGEDDEGVLGPAQVVSPMGEGFHHGKQLSFVDIVVALGRGKCGGVVCDQMELRFPFFIRGGVPFASLLGEYCSDPVCRGIRLQVETSFKVGLDEDWFSAHEGFERLKGLELGFPPVPY